MSNTTTKLTPAQEALIPEYIKTYLAHQLSTTPCDHKKAEDAIKASYKYLKLPEPKFVWAPSPFAGIKIAAQLAEGKEDVTPEEIAKQKDTASFGSFEAYWVAFYAFVAEQIHGKKDDLIEIVKDIVANCGVYWTFEDIVVMTEKPVNIHTANKKLHNPDGLAIEYPDGRGLFAVNGTVHRSMLDMTIAEKLGAESEKTA